MGIDSTIKIDSNLRVESILRIDSTPLIDSNLRIDSTDPLVYSSQFNVFLHSFKIRIFDPPLANQFGST